MTKEEEEHPRKKKKTSHEEKISEFPAATKEEPMDLTELKINPLIIQQLQRIEERQKLFFKNVASIAEVNPEKAEHLAKTFISNNSSVFAEANVLGTKAKKKTIKLLKLPQLNSTDAYYLQMKPGSIEVRHEIKSATGLGKGDVNAHIMDAEAQHKARLYDETEPTWHKTTVEKHPDNPWPFSSIDKRDIASPEKILEKAEELVNVLSKGIRQPHLQKIELVEHRWKSAPVKKSKNEKNKNKNKKEKKEDDVNIAKLQEAATWQFFAHPADSKLTASQREEIEKRKQIAERVAKHEEEDKEYLHRLLIVTERITVSDVYDGKSLVLDRIKGGNFRAHWKDEKSELKRERRHWDVKDEIRSKEIYDEDSNRRLHLAVNETNIRLIKSFLNFGDNPNEINIHKQTPLHLAVEGGKVEIVELLIENGAQLDVADEEGNTPLHIAVKNDDTNLVKFLIEKGAEVQVENDKHETPFDLAEKNEDILMLLKKNVKEIK